MPRPKRPRYIVNQPVASAFRPEGVGSNGEVVFSLEEFEAVRLIDYEKLGQSHAAEMMNVSRQTFGRILKGARHKLSKFIVEAKRLRVEGGCYKMHGKRRGFGRHGGCGHRFSKHGNNSKPGYCDKEDCVSERVTDGINKNEEVAK